MITVFGSLNIDLVTRVEVIPRPGETVLGPSYAIIPGGKGANQALAARRAGAEVRLVGAVGDDGFAGAALSLLLQEGVDCSLVRRVDAPTGAAFIAVDAAGENAIVVASGANALASAAVLHSLSAGPGDVLLLQREVPDGEALAAARWMHAAGGRVVLNAAPAGAVPADLLACLDTLIVNEHEAAVVGDALGLAGSVDAIAAAIDARHRVTTIVTLGAAGVLGWTGGVRRTVPALPIRVVDTTAAGDAFCGAYAAAVAAGLHFSTAMARATAAGSLACTAAGAQPSLPSAAAIDAALAGWIA
ncbi:MAG: ribokinase [Alsobacter sp.]